MDRVRTKCPHPILLERDVGESDLLAAKPPALCCTALPLR